MAKAKYEYKGRAKIVERIPTTKLLKQKPLIPHANFVLVSSYPMANVKRLGCPLSNNYYEDQALDLQLDLIQAVCKNPYILIVGGFECKRILKHPRRSEFQFIENQIYEFTNSSEDMRIALNAIPRGYTVVVDANFIPSVDTYSLLTENINQSRIVYSVRQSDCVGVNLNANSVVNYFGYSCANKIKGAYSLSQIDVDKIRKRCIGSSFNKTKFDYEILSELKMIGIEDTSKSLRLDENYEAHDNNKLIL